MRDVIYYRLNLFFKILNIFCNNRKYMFLCKKPTDLKMLYSILNILKSLQRCLSFPEYG